MSCPFIVNVDITVVQLQKKEQLVLTIWLVIQEASGVVVVDGEGTGVDSLQ